MKKYQKIVQLIYKIEEEAYMKWLISLIEKFKTVLDNEEYILNNNIREECDIKNLKYLSTLFNIVSEYYMSNEGQNLNCEKNVLFIYEDRIIGLHTIFTQETVTVASYVSQEHIHIPYQDICQLEDIICEIKKQKYKDIESDITEIFKNIKLLQVDKDKLLKIMENVYDD